MFCQVILFFMFSAFDIGNADTCIFNENCECSQYNSEVNCVWNSPLFPIFSVYNGTPIIYIQFTITYNDTATFVVPPNAIFNLQSITDYATIVFTNSYKDCKLSPQVYFLPGSLNNINNGSFTNLTFEHLYLPNLVPGSFQQYSIAYLYFDYCCVDLVENNAFIGLSVNSLAFNLGTFTNVQQYAFSGINFYGPSALGFSSIGFSNLQPFKYTTNEVVMVLQLNSFETINDFSFCTCSSQNACNNTNVQVIILQYNKISYVSNQAFSNLPNLFIIDLNHNRIQSIDLNNIFYTFNQYNHLYLAYNSLVTFIVTNYSENSIVNLHLHHNQITNIPTKSFQSLYMLRYVDLSYNKIGYIAANSFYNCPNLYSVDLNNNPILIIEPGAFNGLYGGSFGLYNLEDLTSVDLLIFYGMVNLSSAALSYVGVKIAYVSDTVKLPSLLSYISITQTGTIARLDPSLESWLQVRPKNVYDFSNNINVACSQEIQWMATYSICNPVQIILNSTFCQNGNSVLRYLETFQPVC